MRQNCRFGIYAFGVLQKKFVAFSFLLFPVGNAAITSKRMLNNKRCKHQFPKSFSFGFSHFYDYQNFSNTQFRYCCSDFQTCVGAEAKIHISLWHGTKSSFGSHAISVRLIISIFPDILYILGTGPMTLTFIINCFQHTATSSELFGDSREQSYTAYSVPLLTSKI